jgi:hypothetical protein
VGAGQLRALYDRLLAERRYPCQGASIKRRQGPLEPLQSICHKSDHLAKRALSVLEVPVGDRHIHNSGHIDRPDAGSPDDALHVSVPIRIAGGVILHSGCTGMANRQHE